MNSVRRDVVSLAAHPVDAGGAGARREGRRLDPLGRRLTLAMVLFSSVVTTLITAIQLYSDYRHDIDRIEENFHFIHASYLPVLVDSVWTANDAQVRAQLEGLLRLRDMEFLSITIEGKARWSAGEKRSRRLIENETDLVRGYRGQPVVIGRLALGASADAVLERIADKLLMVLAENAVKTILVAGFVLWLFRVMVTRHLDRLADFAEGMRAATLSGPALRLDRPIGGRWRPDELDAVVDAINAMRGKLGQTYDELRTAADRLAQSEQRYRALVSNVPGVMYRREAAPPQALQFISDGIVALGGYPQERFSGARAMGWSDLILAEDRPRVEREIAQALEQHRSYEIEFRIRHVDGGVRWLSDRGRPAFDTAGAPTWIDGVAVDVTERIKTELALRKSERKLSQHLQQTMVGIIEWDTGFRVAEWNPAAERIFGYARDEAMGRSAKDLILTPEVFPVIDAVWAALLSNSGGTHSNNQNLTRERRLIDCEWFNTTLLGDEGEVIGVMSLVRDVTEHKRAEQRIQAALREKEVLLKEIYHRVKNNLQVIASLLTLQGRANDDARVRAALDDSAARVRAMALVHEQLYRSSDLERIDFEAYLGNLVKYLRDTSLAASRGIVFTVEAARVTVGIETAIPCGLLVNELVSNALKHAFPEGRGGRIAIRFGAAEDGQLMLEVADDGVGWPEGFDYRESKSLGLQLVDSLSQQLQGEVSMEGRQGVCYRLRFSEIEEEKPK